MIKHVTFFHLRAYPDSVKHAFTELGGPRGDLFSDESYAAENGHITGIDIWYSSNNEVQALRARCGHSNFDFRTSFLLTKILLLRYGIIWGPWHGGRQHLFHATYTLESTQDYFNR